MIAGKLDRRITLMKRITGAKDAFGDPSTTHQAIGTVWAMAKFVSDAERQRAAKPEAVVTNRFQVRYSSVAAQIGAQDQIVFDSRTYEIIAPPKEIGRREGLEFSATARAENL